MGPRGRSNVIPGELLPVADGQLANGELPDHDALAGQTIVAARELQGERLARGVGAGVVLGDPIDGSGPS